MLGATLWRRQFGLTKRPEKLWLNTMCPSCISEGVPSSSVINIVLRVVVFVFQVSHACMSVDCSIVSTKYCHFPSNNRIRPILN